jgi:Tol biopolymer transport system component
MKTLLTVSNKTAILRVTITLTTIITSFSQITYGQNIIRDGAVATIFLQEGVSVPNDQSAPCFTPDGKTLYLSDSNTICFSKMVNGKWTKPRPVSISGRWKDWDATLSPDGKWLVFVSNRPLEGTPQDKPQRGNHLWRSHHLSGENWSVPRHLDSPINIDGFNAYAPCISNTGSLCFCSRGRDGHKGMGGYYAKWLVDHYEKPVLLSLNGDKDIFDPYISPDERFILFASEGNLYISYHQDDKWSAGEKLSAQVNNGGTNGSPYVSQDGKMLYFSSNLTQGILMIPVNIPKAIY